MRQHPLSEQCPATSKRTKQQCQQRVIGGGPCSIHGGKAPQVAAKREARIMLWEAQQKQEPIEVRDPGDALLAAAETADELMQRLRIELAKDGTLSPSLLAAIGDWLDRSGRLNKTVLDARLDERSARLLERNTRISELQSQQLREVLRRILTELGHDLTPGGPVAEVVVRHLHAMAEEDIRLRYGPNVRRGDLVPVRRGDVVRGELA